MFVIVQTWRNLDQEMKNDRLAEKMGVAMERAGVAITVTSVTDVLAFAVGGSTTLPALRSFCVFCGVGILFVYALQATWFVAWMTIDQVGKKKKHFCN